MASKRILSLLFHWVIPLLILGVTTTSVIMLGAKTKPNRKQKPPRISVPVQVVQARSHDGPLKISATGTVVPFREVELAAEVSGKVIWTAEGLRAGRFVNEGDELLKIDPTDYELRIAQQEQQLDKAAADLARVAVDQQNVDRLIQLAGQTLELRERELERIKALQQSRATSDTEYDAAESNFLEATQLVTTHENQRRALEAEAKSLAAAQQLASIGLVQARGDLRRTVVRAPFSGVVIATMAEADSHLQAGEPIAVVEDTAKVEVRCNLRKEDLDFLPRFETTGVSQDGDAYRLPPVPVSVRYSRAGQVYEWQGVLSRQDGLGMDERTRTMPVRILVDQPRACTVDTAGGSVQPIALVRGMFVHVDLHCEPDRPLLAIPEETIRPGKTVWLMRDEQLVIQPIRIVRIEDSIAYVDARGGKLSGQEQIISSPVPGAKAGLSVTAKPPNDARHKMRSDARSGSGEALTKKGTPKEETAGRVELAEEGT